MVIVVRFPVEVMYTGSTKLTIDPAIFEVKNELICTSTPSFSLRDNLTSLLKKFLTVLSNFNLTPQLDLLWNGMIPRTHFE